MREFHCNPIGIPDIESGRMKTLFKTLAVSTGLLLFGAAPFTGCSGGGDEGEVMTEEEEAEAEEESLEDESAEEEE